MAQVNIFRLYRKRFRLHMKNPWQLSIVRIHFFPTPQLWRFGAPFDSTFEGNRALVPLLGIELDQRFPTRTRPGLEVDENL